MAQYARPTSDVTDGTWTGQDSGIDLWTYIDEAVASDADYLDDNALGYCEVALSSIQDEGVWPTGGAYETV